MNDSTESTFAAPPRPARLLARRTFTPAGPSLLACEYTLHGDHFPHDHDFLEAVLVLGGEGRHATVSGEEPLAAGDALLLRPGVWHAYRACRGLCVYNCCFGVGMLERELAPVADDALLRTLLWAAPAAGGTRGMVRLRLDGEAMAGCRAHLDAIAGAGREPGRPGASAEQVGHLILFLARLGRGLAGGGEAAPRGLLHPAVRAGVRLLEDGIHEEWTLERLAGRLHLERSYLTRLFKAGVGLPPMAYLARARAERAARLLLRSDLPVSAVGAAVGWPDANYFARRFRAHFGLSATEYRRRFRPAAIG